MRSQRCLLLLVIFWAPSASGVTISGSNIQLTQPLRDFAEKKCIKATSHFSSHLKSVDVHLKIEHRGGGLHDNAHKGYCVHVAQAVCTLHRDKRVLRVCSESDDNMYASLDILSDRLSRQLRKCKERKSPRHAVGASHALSEAGGLSASPAPSEPVPEIRSIPAIDAEEVLSEAVAMSQLNAELDDELDLDGMLLAEDEALRNGDAGFEAGVHHGDEIVPVMVPEAGSGAPAAPTLSPGFDWAVGSAKSF